MLGRVGRNEDGAARESARGALDFRKSLGSCGLCLIREEKGRTEISLRAAPRDTLARLHPTLYDV